MEKYQDHLAIDGQLVFCSTEKQTWPGRGFFFPCRHRGKFKETSDIGAVYIIAPTYLSKDLVNIVLWTAIILSSFIVINNVITSGFILKYLIIVNVKLNVQTK